MDRDALIEFITEAVTGHVIRAASEIQMTNDEFCEAFGVDSTFRPNGATRALSQSTEMSMFHRRLESPSRPRSRQSTRG